MILPYGNHRSLGHTSTNMLNSNLDIWPTSGANKNNRNIFEHRRSVTIREIRDSLGIVSPKDASVVHLSCWMIRKKNRQSLQMWHWSNCVKGIQWKESYTTLLYQHLFDLMITTPSKKSSFAKPTQTWHKNQVVQIQAVTFSSPVF